MAGATTDRMNTLTVALGINGCGKTTLLRRMVAAELKKPGGRVLVVTPDDREWTDIPLVHPRFRSRIRTYTGARRLIYTKGDLQLISTYMHTGLLLFDDCRSYLPASTDMELHELMIRRRQRNIDIVFSAHGFTDLPPKVFTFASHYILWRTRDNAVRRKNHILDWPAMEERVKRINEKGQSDIHYHEIFQA